jgi:AAA family ATP:ADP antiporter
MTAMPTPPSDDRGRAVDRLLRIFGDVRAGEGGRALLMFFNIFLLLVAYYVLKTVREPLILTRGGAELKSYAAAAQALSLLFYVPAYGWLASRLPRERLIVAVILFFIACIQFFYFAGLAGAAFVGFAFYVWVGIFSLTMIAQFWSFANDVYLKSEGDRLFPLIAVGSTAGAPLGAALAERLFVSGVTPWTMMQVATAILLLHLLLYRFMRGKREGAASAPGAPVGGTTSGFALVLRSPYLRLFAALLILLNIVNTTGEFILSGLVTQQADALAAGQPDFDRGAFIGAFYGNYFFWVNIASVTIQALLVSRIVRWFGMAGALFALPIVAFGVYGLALTGAGLAFVRWVKTAENAADYSVMNTARQMLWLPTSREEKYKAKQAIDTFFVRTGDLLSAGVVYVGTHLLALRTSRFAAANLIFVGGALTVAFLLYRQYREVAARARAAERAA